MNLNNGMLTKLIVENLSFIDTVNLCSATKTLQERCQRLNVYDKILVRDYPLAALTNYPAFEHLKLIERNYHALYYYDIDEEETKFAEDQVSFRIPGLPPPTGTKVYIVSTTRLIDYYPRYECFVSKQEAINHIRNSNTNKYNLFFDVFFDEISVDLFNRENYINFIKNNPESVNMIQRELSKEYNEYSENEKNSEEYNDEYEEYIKYIRNLNSADKIISHIERHGMDIYDRVYITNILFDSYPNISIEFALNYIENNNDYRGHNILFKHVILP